MNHESVRNVMVHVLVFCLLFLWIMFAVIRVVLTMRLVFPTSAPSAITQRCLLYLSKVYMMKNGI